MALGIHLRGTSKLTLQPFLLVGPFFTWKSSADPHPNWLGNLFLLINQGYGGHSKLTWPRATTVLCKPLPSNQQITFIFLKIFLAGFCYVSEQHTHHCWLTQFANESIFCREIVFQELCYRFFYIYILSHTRNLKIP